VVLDSESSDDNESYTISDFTETRRAIEAGMNDTHSSGAGEEAGEETEEIDMTQCCPVEVKVGACNVCGTRLCSVHAETCSKKKLCRGKHYCYYHTKHSRDHERV